MTHPKFGNKFTCWNCAAKFYDMNKPGPRCPKCSSDPKDDPALKAGDKSSKKGKDDAAAGEDFEEETFESDMDELAADDDDGVEDDAEEAEAPDEE